MPFLTIRSDLTTMAADAIVSPDNAELSYSGGASAQIFEAAGLEDMRRACAAVAPCAPGCAAITPGFRLRAKYVIHTVGPVWAGGTHHEAETLASCYRESLRLAAKHGCRSVAFPLIATGTYGYPYEAAQRVAAETIRAYLAEEDDGDMSVTLVLYDRERCGRSTDLYAQLPPELRRNAPVPPVNMPMERRMRPLPLGFGSRRKVREVEEDTALPAEPAAMPMAAAPAPAAMPKEAAGPRSFDDLADWIGKQHEQTFVECLFDFIDRTGLTDAEIYNRSNLDRRHFSKMRSDRNYRPTKGTVLALCMGLELDADDAATLLRRAGYAFSDADRRDQIVLWCLEHRYWHIDEVNLLLFSMELEQLGQRTWP